jgi:hypothetical protein
MAAIRYVLAVVAALGILGRPARATLIVQPELATAVRDADAVVHAVVERTGTQMAYNASTSPWSVAELRVLQWLSTGEGERLWIRDPSGVTGADRCWARLCTRLVKRSSCSCDAT